MSLLERMNFDSVKPQYRSPLPEEIRGFGSVKEETVVRVQVQVKVLRARLIELQAVILAGVA